MTNPEPWLEELAQDEAVMEALRTLGEIEQARPRPLCPRCAKRERGRDEDWCQVCVVEKEIGRHVAANAAKTRYWHKTGKHDRRNRQDDQ